MSMFGGGDDDDEAYTRYREDRGMFGGMDLEEFKQKREQAREIASGLTMGTFQRDEEVWQMVRDLKEKE